MHIPTRGAERYDIAPTAPEKMAMAVPRVWLGAPGWTPAVIGHIRIRSCDHGRSPACEDHDDTIARDARIVAVVVNESWIGRSNPRRTRRTVRDMRQA